jgi:hypothetical protein
MPSSTCRSPHDPLSDAVDTFLGSGSRATISSAATPCRPREMRKPVTLSDSRRSLSARPQAEQGSCHRALQLRPLEHRRGKRRLAGSRVPCGTLTPPVGPRLLSGTRRRLRTLAAGNNGNPVRGALGEAGSFAAGSEHGPRGTHRIPARARLPGPRANETGGRRGRVAGRGLSRRAGDRRRLLRIARGILSALLG